MSFLTPQRDLDAADAARQREVSYYVGNPAKNLRGHLYDFLVDILGYDALSKEFHKPMLDAWDRMDLRRMRIWMGLEPRGDQPIDDLDLWFRGGIKTWCKRGQIIRYLLWDPTCTVTWWHAVEEKAVESGEAIAEQLVKNKALRRLFPSGVLPAMNRKKFYTGGSFRLSGQRIGDSPTFVAMGAGGESTGAHSRVGVLDDFVGYQDVVDGQMHKKKQFYRATVRNVVMRTNEKHGWVTAIGTHWAGDDPYVDWRGSSDWVCTVRACLETDGKPDPEGQPVYLSREQIEKEKREQGNLWFAFQMMNDPSPSGEKPWIRESCEQTCTLEQAKGEGHIVALCDPAPRAVGVMGWEGRAALKSGTKNWWANVIVKLRLVGESRRIIVLDAEQSQNWGLDEGMDRLIKLAMRWRAAEIYAETTSTPVYLEAALRSKKELGCRSRLIGANRHNDSDDRLTATYNANAKIGYLSTLADRAKEGEVLICDSVPGDMKDEFWKQMRGFMPRADGSTGIPFDDLSNAIAFSTDPYFRRRYHAVAEEFTESPFRRPEREEAPRGNRYMQW